MKLKDYKDKKMQDPEFAEAYEEMQPEMNAIRAMVEAGTSQKPLQKQFVDETAGKIRVDEDTVMQLRLKSMIWWYFLLN